MSHFFSSFETLVDDPMDVDDDAAGCHLFQAGGYLSDYSGGYFSDDADGYATDCTGGYVSDYAGDYPLDDPFTLNLLDRLPRSPSDSLIPSDGEPRIEPMALDLALGTAGSDPEIYSPDPESSSAWVDVPEGNEEDLFREEYGIERLRLDLEEEVLDVLVALNEVDGELHEFFFGSGWVDDEEDDVYAYGFGFEDVHEESAAGGGRTPTAKAVVDRLPSVVVVAADEEGEMVVCAVCKDEVAAGETVKRLPCSHRYHEECILPWLSMKNTCPVCRYVLPAEDPEEVAAEDPEEEEAAEEAVEALLEEDFWYGWEEGSGGSSSGGRDDIQFYLD